MLCILNPVTYLFGLFGLWLRRKSIEAKAIRTCKKFEFKNVLLGDVQVEGNVLIGEGTYINSGQVLAGKISAVVIGKQCNIGYNVLISARTHLSEDISNVIEKDIFIGNNVWIGNNVVIREGINIGNNCIVGANSVVTHDVEDNTVVGGVPARVIKVLKCHE
jgi:acetyltransferase-like isoleucine patch superfamily enzyme